MYIYIYICDHQLRHQLNGKPSRRATHVRFTGPGWRLRWPSSHRAPDGPLHYYIIYHNIKINKLRSFTSVQTFQTHTHTLPKQGVNLPDEMKIRMKADESEMTMKMR